MFKILLRWVTGPFSPSYDLTLTSFEGTEDILWILTEHSYGDARLRSEHSPNEGTSREVKSKKKKREREKEKWVLQEREKSGKEAQDETTKTHEHISIFLLMSKAHWRQCERIHTSQIWAMLSIKNLIHYDTLSGRNKSIKLIVWHHFWLWLLAFFKSHQSPAPSAPQLRKLIRKLR